MTRKILHHATGAVIWEGNADTVREAIHAAMATRADLSRADLSWADLSGAHLSGANLSRANLSRADLSWADLSGAHLSWADLSGAHLSGADLSGANLSWANLSWAHLSWANLSGANLSGADLSGANLSRANQLVPPMVLLANWGDVSDDLCADLMNYDASNHPTGAAAFAAWVAGGPCPYDGCRVARSARFTERKDCWHSERPLQSALQLMDRLLAEKTKRGDEGAE